MKIKMSIDDIIQTVIQNSCWHVLNYFFMIENDNQIINEINVFIKIINMKFEVNITQLSSSYSKKQLNTYVDLNVFIIISSMISISNRFILFCITAVTFPYFKSQNQSDLIQNEKEWDITRIIGKKWKERSYQYLMRWKNTWLSKSKLENAQQLLREFEAKSQAQRERKRSKPANETLHSWISFLLLWVFIFFLIQLFKIFSY